MDSNNKNSSQNRNTAQASNYSPWNLLFTSRNRTNSETSVSSTNSQSSQTGTQFGGLQRQTSKDEEYLWMMWRVKLQPKK